MSTSARSARGRIPRMTPRQRRMRRRQRRAGGARRGLLVVLGIGVMAALATALGVIVYVIAVASSAPNIDSLKPVDKGQNSEVFASNGRRLGFIENDELRQLIPVTQMPQSLKQAT